MKRLSGFIAAALALFALGIPLLSGGCAAKNDEGFAIYLTAADTRPRDMINLSHFDLAAKPIIAMSDISVYYAATHEITLTDDAFARVTQLQVPTSGKSFVVCLDKKPIYWGAFWTPISSESFGGVTIMLILPTPETNTLELELGYPSQGFYNGIDPRGNAEIMQALDKTGKLITMLPRSMKGYELYSWQYNGQWNYTLITGTNRNKTTDEIIANANTVSGDGWVQIHVVGVEAVKDAIGRIPEGEWVTWLGSMREPGTTSAVTFGMPDAATVAAIKEFALERGLNFNVP